MTITTYIYNLDLKEMMKLYPQQALLGCLTLKLRHHQVGTVQGQLV